MRVKFSNCAESFVCDRDDWEIAKSICWFKNNTGYARGSVNKRQVLFHNYILGVDTTTDIEVDHIDGDRLNNTRSNLRLCTRRENAFNKGVYKNNSSGVSGVYYQKKPQKWSSYINVDKHMINIGTFNNFEDAVAARLAAEKLYFGEFSRSNNQYAEKIS